MNRTELEAVVAEQSGMSRKDVAAIIDKTFAAIEASLKRGDDVRLLGFGTFSIKESAAKEGHNPRTGKKIAIPAKRRPVFRAGKGLKEAVSA
jgi:DNA-binding protein HU-beta